MTNMPFNLLLVDDEVIIKEFIQLIIPKNWKLHWVNNANDIATKNSYHCALVDIHLNGQASGLEVIKSLKNKHPQLTILAISGDLSLEIMETGILNGSSRFLAKPLNKAEILSELEKVEALWLLRSRETKGSKDTQWLGQSPESEKIRLKVASLKGDLGPILINGETGTGKEVIARLLNIQEQVRPFIAVNMGGITENLFESEFFGHVKGAFTGADSIKVGLIEAADGGDLFLDEIEALPMSHQAKLLRFLENGEYRRVGAKEIKISNCRIIAASNRDLKKMVAENKFREDLLYRLSGKIIELPPLRDRQKDVLELAEHFLKQRNRSIDKKFLPEAIELMETYNWPGNVRELKRICEQLIINAPLPVIRSIDLKSLISIETQDSSSVNFSAGLATILENYEKKILADCLSKFQDVEKAAEVLKIAKSGLYKKIKEYNLEF